MRYTCMIVVSLLVLTVGCGTLERLGITNEVGDAIVSFYIADMLEWAEANGIEADEAMVREVIKIVTESQAAKDVSAVVESRASNQARLEEYFRSKIGATTVVLPAVEPVKKD